MNGEPTDITISISPNFTNASTKTVTRKLSTPMILSKDSTVRDLLLKLSSSGKLPLNSSELTKLIARSRIDAYTGKTNPSIRVGVSGTNKRYPISSKIKEINIPKGHTLDVRLPKKGKISFSIGPLPGEPGEEPPLPPDGSYQYPSKKDIRSQPRVVRATKYCNPSKRASKKR